MSDDIVIRAEGVGKKYTVARHMERERYITLRDIVARSAVNIWHKTSDLARGRTIIGREKTEEFWALNDVSFEVRRGEVLGIVGRNGAGKSTLLKILSRITEPSKGRVTISGRVASLLEVGTGFHPELSGRENIYLNGAILGMLGSEIRRKFDEIVSFAEVGNFLDTPVKRYSSGMYVRLAFAVAAHLDPEILVVDEVLAVGDIEFQRRCLGKMQSVSRQGRTVLFVSHQLGALRDLCDRGILLARGHAKTFDSIDGAIAEYLDDSRTPAELSQMSHISDVRFGDVEAGHAHVFFGDPLVIRATFRNLPDFPTGATVAIRDSFGQRISLFSTNPHDGMPLPRGGAVEVRFVIEFCPYAPGSYYVDVGLTEPHRKVEEITSALKFEVVPTARGGNLAYGAPFGVFFPDHCWAVREAI